VFASTPNGDDVRFQDTDPAKVRTSIRTMNEKLTAVAGPLQDVIVSSIENGTGLPLMTVGMRFSDGRSNEAYWGVLTVWQTRILKSLPDNEESFSVVLDQAKRVVLSRRSDLDSSVVNTLIDAKPTGVGAVEFGADSFVVGRSEVPDLGLQ